MPPDLKHRIIAGAFGAIAASRADRWLAPMARGLGAILMFHHVRPARPDPFQPNRLLEITPDFLDLTLRVTRELGFDIVPLDEVPARLATPKGRFVALTFDDGYRDNRDDALPILRRHDAPWTMFVTTDYASGSGRLWWIELEEIVRRSTTIALPGLSIAAGTPSEKADAFALAYRHLRSGPEELLRDTLAAWGDAVELDRPAFVRGLCLGWDELGEMAKDPRLSFGAHTVTHAMLAKHDEATARREIEESRSILAARLKREICHLAYPVGDPTSASPRDFAIAKGAGFITALTTRPGHLFAAHADHLTALPRVSMNGLHQSEAALRALLSGLPFWLWNRGRRLNVR